MTGESGAFVPAPVGWNTWDVHTHTGMTHLPSGLRVRFGLLGADGPVVDGFTWRDGLVRLGPHSVDGRYAEVTVRVGEVPLRLTLAGGPGDVLYARAESTGQPVLVVEGADGAAPEAPEGAVGAVRAGGGDWVVGADAPFHRIEGAAGPGGLAVAFSDGDGDGDRGDSSSGEGDGTGSRTVELRIAPAAAPGTVAGAGAELAARRAESERTRLRTGGWLGDAADALGRAVTWNTVHVPELDRVLTPTSRDFVSARRRGFYGSWALHTWDTFFTGLVAGLVDRDYARGVFGQMLPYADASGMLPNRVSDDRGRTDDRSQPPIGALTVHKAYLAGGLSPATRDRALLTGTFPALLAWHDWWPTARRGPHGLLAWGSDPVPGDPGSATLDRAKRESGLDDSPMYDEAVYDPATRTMDLADVGLNALHIADAEALAAIADELGEAATAARLRAGAERARGAADRLLWDAGAGGYRNLTAAGEHDPHVSPTMLYPLLAGLPDQARAEALAAALLRPGALGGQRPLPSVARDDPGFAATYWRGRIWAPMAYLAVEGLRRYELTAHSRPVVNALLRLFLDEWREHGHVRENYPAGTGEDLTGLKARSDGLMAWGGLLAYLAFGELADARPDGWRFAHPGEPAELDNLPLGEGRLGVRAGARLTVRLDGRVLLDAAPGVVVRGYRRTADRVTGTAEGTGDLAVTAPDGGGPVLLAVRGEPRHFDIGPAGSPGTGTTGSTGSTATGTTGEGITS